jgi:beta-lactamase regulating signal transducer with metallopeptidase domain
MTDATGWFFENMAWATGAMLLVLVLRRPAARLFGVGPAYALWLLPALRLLAPSLPPLSSALPALAPAETLVIWAGDSNLPADPSALGLAWLVGLWAAGALVFLTWQWLAYRRLLVQLGHGAHFVGDHEGVALFESPGVQGPIALGLLDRRIVVPADFALRYTPDEQRLALEHERLHHRRGDLWWNLAAMVVLALNWFNPVAWLAFRAFREDQELACDAAVAATAAADLRQDYARAMIKSATRPGLIAACPLNHADQLKRRLRMLRVHSKSRARWLGGAAAVTLLAGATLATAGLAQQADSGAQKAAPAEPRQERREQRIIIHTDGDGPRVIHREEGARSQGETSERRVERVIVMNHRREGSGDDHAEHSLRMRHGDSEVVIPSCDDGQRDEVNEGTDNDRTRIVLCSRGTVSPADRAERLQHVRDRLANDSELSAEQRARVTAALDREIARIRAQ